MKLLELSLQTDGQPRFRQHLGEIKRYVADLPLDFDAPPGESHYDNAVLPLVDAVLSMNRQYAGFVVPRVELIRHSGIQTIDQLNDAITHLGISGFCQLWHYNHPQRVEILKRLIAKFQAIKKDMEIEDDLIAINAWGTKSTIADFDNFDVKGIGFTTFQYLRLLCGADTVKPDIHLRRAVKDATGRPMSKLVTVTLVEETAHELGIPARRLDYALWRYYSQGKSN